MATNVGEVSLDLNLNTKPFSATLNALQGKTAKASKALAGSLDKAFSTNRFSKFDGAIKNFTAGLKMPQEQFRAMGEAAREAEAKVETLLQEQAKLRTKHTTTPEYRQLQKEIQQAETELDRLVEKQIELGSQPGADWAVRQFQELDDEITKSNVHLETMRERLANMAASGSTDIQRQEWNGIKSAIESARNEASYYQSKISRLKLGQGFRKAVVDTFKGGIKHVKNFKGRVDSAVTSLKKIPVISPMINKAFSGMAKNANKMKRGLMMGMGVKGLMRLGAAGAIALASVRMLREGMSNLLQYDVATANSVNTLKASLETLKNALATAFAPIVQVVAPYLTALINMLTRAATAVAHFVSALTGKKSVIVAQKQSAKAMGGFSSSAGKAAKNSKKATKEAKKLQRTLMGFDKINKLDSKDKDSNTGGGGAGGGGGIGGGIGGASGLFDTVPVDKKMSDLAKRFKKAWAKADFYWFGEMLADKLNNAMAKIPWGKINKTAWKIAHSIGTFINGFVENFDWKLLGRTISNGILVAFNFVSTFIETVNWQAIGKAIVNLIMGIRWGALIKAVARLAGNLVGALAGVVWGILKTAGKAIGKKIKSHFGKAFKDAGGNVIKGFFLGIGRAIVGIPKWIIRHIFKPFIKGFKKAFGISSPSKKMKPLGKEIIMGLLEGAKNNLKSIVKWFEELPGKIKKAVGDFTGGVFDFAINLKDNFTDKISSVKEKWGEFSDRTVTLTADLVQNFKDKTISTIKGAWNAVSDKRGTLTAKLANKVKTGVLDKLRWGWNAIKNQKAKLQTFLTQDFKTKTLNTLKSAWKAIKKKKAKLTASLSGNKAVLKLRSAWDKIKKKKATLTVSVKTALAKGYNSVVRKLRKSGLKPVSSFGYKLPLLAQGGWVAKNSPRLALIGDNRHESEIVAPDSKLSAMARQAAHEANRGGSDAQTIALLRSILQAIQNQDTNVYLDGKEIKDNVVRRINNHTKATGQLEILV